jgi:hypothetical protein
VHAARALQGKAPFSLPVRRGNAGGLVVRAVLGQKTSRVPPFPQAIHKDHEEFFRNTGESFRDVEIN